VNAVGGRPEGLLRGRAEVGVSRFDRAFVAFRIGDRDGPVLRGVLGVSTGLPSSRDGLRESKKLTAVAMYSAL